MNIFRTRYRSLLESELEKFDNLSAELFADKDMEELKTYTETKTVAEERVSFGKATNHKFKKRWKGFRGCILSSLLSSLRLIN